MPHQKDSLFRVLDSMDAAADSLNHLPAFVWPAVLIGYAAHLGDTSALSERPLKTKASSESPGSILFWTLGWLRRLKLIEDCHEGARLQMQHLRSWQSK